MASILLATPTADYNVTDGFARSLFGLTKLLTSMGINSDFRTIRSSDIELARNRFATRFLKGGYSHLLFIDSDMAFAPQDVLACLELTKPVVGVAYVRRDIDLVALAQFLHKSKLEPSRENVEAAVSCVSHFNLELDREGAKGPLEIEVVRGFIRVKQVGTGIMLIERDVFSRMIEGKCVGLWKNRQLDQEDLYKDGIYGFFNKVKVGDRLLSEDFSFCHRWVNDCKGEIWCKIDSAVLHQGAFNFSGRFFDKLKRNVV
jgi:hypothetical protein